MRFFSIIVALLVVSSPCFASEGSPFDCVNRVMVFFDRGPNWDAFEQYYDAHVQYMLHVTETDQVEAAGPFTLPGGDIDGGVSIVKTADVQAASALMSQDPMVIHKVMTLSARAWTECKRRAN